MQRLKSQKGSWLIAITLMKKNDRTLEIRKLREEYPFLMEEVNVAEENNPEVVEKPKRGIDDTTLLLGRLKEGDEKIALQVYFRDYDLGPKIISRATIYQTLCAMGTLHPVKGSTSRTEPKDAKHSSDLVNLLCCSGIVHSLLRCEETWTKILVVKGQFARIALVKPDKARGVEDVILRAAQYGQITEKVSEQKLIELLEQINTQTTKQTKVTIQRRRNVLEDDD
ncbi:hypothetical protein MTR67_009040 [Solanum verrucosum]|uniref:Uncharacterized protein n=2 Tax=Pentapetalae TaxID=1437201 RepID=A0AAF0TJY4_SOLVR|nr:hypothetical protein MTR67_009040 [Solanum verrucosum]